MSGIKNFLFVKVSVIFYASSYFFSDNSSKAERGSFPLNLAMKLRLFRHSSYLFCTKRNSGVYVIQKDINRRPINGRMKMKKQIYVQSYIQVITGNMRISPTALTISKGTRMSKSLSNFSVATHRCWSRKGMSKMSSKERTLRNPWGLIPHTSLAEQCSAIQSSKLH